MASLHDELIIETDLFEHREVRPHFINDCCFGEDFAAWLHPKLADLTSDGYAIEEPIQEDYGWGFWVRRGKDFLSCPSSCLGTRPSSKLLLRSTGGAKQSFGAEDMTKLELGHESEKPVSPPHPAAFLPSPPLAARRRYSQRPAAARPPRPRGAFRGGLWKR